MIAEEAIKAFIIRCNKSYHRFHQLDRIEIAFGQVIELITRCPW